MPSSAPDSSDRTLRVTTEGKANPMPERRDIHVVPHDHEGWLVRRENQGEPIAHFRTQDEAQEEARRIAREEQVEYVLHNRRGQVREKESHDHDPTNIPG
jgi:hypothetical protein